MTLSGFFRIAQAPLCLYAFSLGRPFVRSLVLFACRDLCVSVCVQTKKAAQFHESNLAGPLVQPLRLWSPLASFAATAAATPSADCPRFNHLFSFCFIQLFNLPPSWVRACSRVLAQ